MTRSRVQRKRQKSGGEVRLTIEFGIPIERTDIHWLEAKLLAERDRCFHDGVRRLLREVEDRAQAALTPCATCGGVWKQNGRKRRLLGTLLGMIAVNRARFRCKSCGAER